MGRKIFVSYKHGDRNIARLNNSHPVLHIATARDYVDHLIEEFKGDEIYKGEGDEDLSEFKDETIKTRLKDKIHDSSITLVLVSPNMKEQYKNEKDQWIPWEISYSLKEITRNDKMSHTNAVLAVVLPDSNNSYSYYINKCDKGYNCDTKNLAKNKLFQILLDNMFNYKTNDDETYDYTCKNCGSTIKHGKSSYIKSVKWCDFLSNKDDYLKQATQIRDSRRLYNITKEIQ